MSFWRIFSKNWWFNGFVILRHLTIFGPLRGGWVKSRLSKKNFFGGSSSVKIFITTKKLCSHSKNRAPYISRRACKSKRKRRFLKKLTSWYLVIRTDFWFWIFSDLWIKKNFRKTIREEKNRKIYFWKKYFFLKKRRFLKKLTSWYLVIRTDFGFWIFSDL